MKKIVIGILAGLMCLSMCACAEQTTSKLDSDALCGTITTTDEDYYLTVKDGDVTATIHNWSNVAYGVIDGNASKYEAGYHSGTDYSWHWFDWYFIHFGHYGIDDYIDIDSEVTKRFQDGDKTKVTTGEVNCTTNYDADTDTMTIKFNAGTADYSINMDINVMYEEVNE